MQKLADETGLSLRPDLAWKPLTSRLAVVELIAATTTKTGLPVQGELDENSCAKGIKVTDAEMAALNVESDPWHPEWNYTIKPWLKVGAVILECPYTQNRRCGCGYTRKAQAAPHAVPP